MFNLTCLKKGEQKNKDSNSFSSLITEAKNKAEENYERVSEDYDFVIAKAITSLEKLSKNFNQENFLKSAELLEQAQRIKQSKPEPYFFLAWLFLFADEITLATKYMQVVSSINNNFEGLDVLKEEISKIQLFDTKEKKVITNEAQKVPSEVVTKKVMMTRAYGQYANYSQY